MIEEFEPDDLDDLMRIWLDTNSSAHPFIDVSVWEDAYDSTREQIPKAEVYIYREYGTMEGFIGIVDRVYIAGLFVDEQFQSQGIGERLLDFCKERYSRLELDVFKENGRAVRFYERNGFTIEEEAMSPDFGYTEFRMAWSRT